MPKPHSPRITTVTGGRKAIAFTVPVNIRAAAPAADGSTSGPPTFDMVAYTGGPLALPNWSQPLVIDQEGWVGLEDQRPVLRDHDFGQIVGHADRTVIEDGKLLASGVVSGNNAHSEEVTKSSKDGFPWKASVGANVEESEFVPDGETAEANGKTWTGPLYIGRRTSLPEISFVGKGADNNTSVKVAATAAGASVMTNFQKWCKAKGIDVEKLDDVQVTALKAAYSAMNPDAEPDEDAPEEPAPASADDEEEDAEGKGKKPTAEASATALANVRATATQQVLTVRREVLAETKRINGIRAICAGKHGNVEARAIEEGWTSEATELVILRAERPKAAHASGSFGINTGRGGALTQNVFAAAAAINAGVSEKYAYEGLTEQEKSIATSLPVRRASSSIYGMFATVAAANGMSLPEYRMSDAVIRAGWEMSNRNVQADGGVGMSTMSIPGITENVLNKQMLQSYNAVATIVDKICYQTGVNDFRPAKRYRMTAGGTLAEVGPTGELKHLSLTDETYTVQATTQGGMLVIDRQTWRNDDMGALVQIPQVLGKRGAITREKLVIMALVAGTSTAAPGPSVGQAALGYNFISTGAKNYQTGAGSALGLGGLTNAVTALADQKDSSGEPIFVEGDRMLVPPALKPTGDNLFGAATIIASALGSTSSAVQVPDKNIHEGRYTPYMTPYLGAASNIPGSTDTGWYLLGDPANGVAPITVSYVDNQRVPIIQRGELNFDQLGMGVRAIWDFGVSLADPRTLIFSAGE